MIDARTRRAMQRMGFEFGAYDGANRRRFVLLTRHDATAGNVARREYDTKRERDAVALHVFATAKAEG